MISKRILGCLMNILSELTFDAGRNTYYRYIACTSTHALITEFDVVGELRLAN